MEPKGLNNIPLIVITGPTASGKTSISIKLAKDYNGEIISADSRAIYKGMDIGTAKPTAEERQDIPHWGIDLVEPGDYFSVSDYKDYVLKKIDEIRSRGNIPFIVGGTGLYIDAVIFDYKFTSKPDANLRQELQHKDIAELLNICTERRIELPENFKNKRYIIRAIENGGVINNKLAKPIDNTIVVGISTEKSVLLNRIRLRTEQLFNAGVVDEAIALGDEYGWNSEAMKSNIYPLIHGYVCGEYGIDVVKEKFIVKDWRLAKRQLTWLRRNPYIKWLPADEVYDYISKYLVSIK